jgi:uncharacterized protein
MYLKSVFILIVTIFFITACAINGPMSPLGKKETSAQLGVRYLLGRGVPQNNAKAFGYFNEAAAQGDPFAENELAYMYAAGKGTPRNNNLAFLYYQRAANHGLASAQYNLGMMYEHGLGTAENKVLAKQWIEKSAASGFEPAKLALQR